MARMNDVGGMQGFGPVDMTDTADNTEPFHADWEARVFALNGALIAQKVYNLDEFRDAVESMPPQDYLAASYYERWFFAIRVLLERKGVLAAGELAEPGEG